MANNNSEHSQVGANKNRRVKRHIALAQVLPTVGKVVAWSVGMGAVGVASSYADTKIKEASQIRIEENRFRLKIDCKKNIFGCIENICWTNCGPRLESADWCFTKKNS